MANYTQLKNQIDSKINTNGRQAITGAILNEALNSMVDAMASDGASVEKNTSDITTLNSTVAAVNSNLVASVEAINKNVADGFNTINGGINNEIRPAIEKNSKDIQNLNATVAAVNSNLVASVEAINKNVADGFNTINGGIDNEIRPEIAKNASAITVMEEKVASALSISVVDGKEVVSLPKNTQIMGTLDDGIYALASVRDYGSGITQTEIGSASLHLCLNTKDDITVDTPDGQKVLAFVDDIPEVPEVDLSPYLMASAASELYQSKGDYALKSEIPSTDGLAAESAVTKLAGDVDYIGNTLIPEMNANTANALNGKVDWDETKSVISLPSNGSISAMRGVPEEGTQPEGGNMICQRTYDSGASYVTEVGTVKNHLTVNSTDRPTVDMSGKSESIAFESDLTRAISFPLRTLQNKVYTQDEILAWFGFEDIPSLKQFIVRGPMTYLKYGITLSYKPMYYRFPINYMAFTSDSQIVLVALGLNTSNDKACKYTITMNLDGAVIDNECNIKIDILELEA